VVTLFFIAANSLALDHSGLMESDETWLAADNPHTVVGHLTVSAGVTLTIEAGVEVYTGDNLRLDIFGDLVAVGTPGQEILFTRSSASNWNYLRFLSGGSGTLEYCTLEYTNNGIHAAGAGTISASNVLLQNNIYAIYSVATSNLSVSNSQLQNNSYGAYATGGTIDLASTTFSGNTTYGFYSENVAPGLLDADVVFTDNATGFRVDRVPNLDLLTTMNVTGSTAAGIYLLECDTPTIDNQILTGNVGDQGALFLDDCGEFTLGAGNTIGGLGLENTWPVTIGTGSYPSATAVIPTASNTNNDIQVSGGSSIRMGTWRKFPDLNYIVTGNQTILAAGALTLDPGVEIYLGEDRRIDIYGSLTAVGLAGQEILFTKNDASNWNYLRFLAEGQGAFDYCTIENAYDGIRAFGSGTITVSNTIMRNNSYAINSVGTSALSVVNTQLQDNSVGAYASGGTIDLASTVFSGNTTYGYYGEGVVPNLTDTGVEFTGNATGFRVDGVADLSLSATMMVTGSTAAGIHLVGCQGPTIDNQVLTTNGGDQGALFLEDCGEFTLGTSNTIGGIGIENSWPVTINAGSFPHEVTVIPTVGNIHNDIQVVGGSIPLTGTWPKISEVNYIITGDLTIPAGNELTLGPGVELHFDNNQGMGIYGTLTAIGIPDQEILFTQNGDSTWNHLDFFDEGHGSFSYCTIEYADNGIHAAGSGVIAAFHVLLQNNAYGIFSDATSSLTVSNCELLNNSHGIFATGGTLDLGSTTFTGNTAFGFHGQNVAANLVDGNVVFTDCATGYRVDGVDGLDLSTTMNVTGSNNVGIHLVDCEGPTIDNQVLTGNFGPGGALFLDDCGEFTLGAGNAIGGPALENGWPLTIGAGSYASAASMIPTVGNTNNDIQVAGGASDRIGIWRNFPDLDYVVTGNTSILDGGSLTLESDLTVRFDPDVGLDISGALEAAGALGQEILFTQNNLAGWNHLRFLSEGGGSFQHCIIENADTGVHATGSGALTFSHATLRNNATGIHSVDKSEIAVGDCMFQDNGYGIHVTGGTIDLASTTFSNNSQYGFFGMGVAPRLLDDNLVFADNAWGFGLRDVPDLNLVNTMTLTGNHFGGIYLQGCHEPTIDNQVLTGNVGSDGAIILIDCGQFFLGAGNTIGGLGQENTWPLAIGPGSFPSPLGVIPITGNLNNDIKVRPGGSLRTGTWPKLSGLDYIVTDDVLVGGELTLDPGVNLKFDSIAGLVIFGTLSAVGTPEMEINFTSNTGSSWKHLRFFIDGSGTFDHCLIENAENAIHAFGSGTVFVSNSTLQNNTYGIYATGSGTITADGDSIVDNNHGIHTTGTADISVSNCLLENNTYGVWATGGTMSFLNDRIINNTSFGIYLNGAAPTFGASLGEWNDIYGNGTGQPGRDLRNGPTDIQLLYVHWGSMDHGQILNQIWDVRDDVNLGYVQILPFINAAHDGEISGVDDPLHEQNVPVAFGLAQNFPNPFNPSTVISFDLAGQSLVNLKVFDISGALVATLVDDQLPPGSHQAVWYGRDDQGRSVPSGMYFYRITAGRNIETRQMMLVK